MNECTDVCDAIQMGREIMERETKKVEQVITEK